MNIVFKKVSFVPIFSSWPYIYVLKFPVEVYVIKICTLFQHLTQILSCVNRITLILCTPFLFSLLMVASGNELSILHISHYTIGMAAGC